MNKKYFFLLLLLAGMLSSCPKWQQDFKHFNSDLVGLNRTVTLYSANGEPIKQWEGRIRIEHVPGGISFISKGKVVVISGTFIVEEE